MKFEIAEYTPSKSVESRVVPAFFYFLAIVFMNVGPRFLSFFTKSSNGMPHYLMTSFLEYGVIAATILLIVVHSLVSQQSQSSYMNKVSLYIILALVFSLIASFYCDVLFMMSLSQFYKDPALFSEYLAFYLKEEAWVYLSLSSLLAVYVLMNKECYFNSFSFLKNENKKYTYLMSLFLIVPLIIVYPLPLMNWLVFYKSESVVFNDLNPSIQLVTSIVYFTSMVGLFIYFVRQRKMKKLNFSEFKKYISFFCMSACLSFIYQLTLLILPLKTISARHWVNPHELLINLGESLSANVFSYGIFFGLFLFSLGIFRWIKQKKIDDKIEQEETTGQFGSAAWASTLDLMQWGYLNKDMGILTGISEAGSSIYIPFKNKLVIAPQGLGKTTTSTIPVLLTHNGPAFVLDVKGELWAVTARYRSEVLGRDVITLDPFNLIMKKDFKEGKSERLLKKYTMNPFDWIPEDLAERHRMLNAFAASLVVNEGTHSTHFDDNAKILIRAYIDYIMSFKREDRSLEMLYQIMCESSDEAKTTFEQMVLQGGRAGAGANQVNRVGVDERGSILSTSYRQIDWLGDVNIQSTMSISNFDLRDFLKGNMDIYVILPEDQTKEHARLFRMTMCLLMTLIIQANPSDLPKKKMLFLLEELAQFGASPDVEHCIEVLRARRVVIWSVFQTLSQINMFSKPDLFKTKPIKQIFTNDDPETMEWIQKLGGDKTIRTKSFSTNKGSSQQWMQLYHGSSSSGEGENIQETGVKLIQINEIRETPVDEQFIFLQGKKPLRCKKTRYFEQPDFSGKFDANPLETGELL